MPIKKGILSLVISKLVSTLSTVQFDVAKNHISYYVTKNNSRSLIGVTKSSIALKFLMFAHSTTIISRFVHIINKPRGFGWLR